MNPNQARMRETMLEKFDGCDSSDPGSHGAPYIWLFGIEPGWPASAQTAEQTPIASDLDKYSIETQKAWPFNRNAFKLLAAIHGDGYSAKSYLEYATEMQPFVRGSKGYFKGNLYPYCCHGVQHWPEYAAEETGFPDKQSYIQWCRDFRLPEIKKWVDEYKPKLFIGVGISRSEDFSQAVFGENIKLEEKRFAVNGHGKRILFKQFEGKTLVVLPHLSGGKNSLNSYSSIQIAGDFIRNLRK